MDGNPSCDIGNYIVELSQILGRGSYGVVYLAHRKDNKQKCAVKNIVFPYDMQRSAKIEEAAKREGDILPRLNHPNIVKHYDIVIFPTSWWIFLEFCELGNLNEYLKKIKTLSFASKADLHKQCAEAVKYIHDQTITHRDLKLENYLVKMMEHKPVIKLSDFGLSKVLEETSSSSMTANRGTALYRAPEQFREENYCEKVDIFSLGLVILVISEFGNETQDTYPQSGLF